MEYMIVTVYSKQTYRSYLLPMGVSQYRIFVGKEQFHIPADIQLDFINQDGLWRIVPVDDCRLVYAAANKDAYSRVLQDGDFLLFSGNNGTRLTVLVEKRQRLSYHYTRFALRDGLTVGRDAENTIRYTAFPTVSRRHARFIHRGTDYLIEDNSSNGVYLNSMRIDGSTRLTYGDWICIFGLKILFLGDFIAMDSSVKGLAFNETLRPYAGESEAEIPLFFGPPDREEASKNKWMAWVKSPYCLHCMRPLSDSFLPCPFCGEIAPLWRVPYQLLPGTLLHSRYLIGRAARVDSDSITYMGRDLSNGGKISVREYFPSADAVRQRGQSPTPEQPLFIRKNNMFTAGLQQFLQAGNTLSALSKTAESAGALTIFQENGTGYAVLAHRQEYTLELLLQKRASLTPEQTLKLLRPVVSLAVQLNRVGFVHGHICPEAIDFDGRTARLNILNAAPMTKAYDQAEEWPDGYGLCFTIYYAITGTAPDPSQQPPHFPAELETSVEPWLKAVLLRGLSSIKGGRFQDVEELEDALYAPKSSARSYRRNGEDDIATEFIEPPAPERYADSDDIATEFIETPAPGGHVDSDDVATEFIEPSAPGRHSDSDDVATEFIETPVPGRHVNPDDVATEFIETPVPGCTGSDDVATEFIETPVPWRRADPDDVATEFIETPVPGRRADSDDVVTEFIDTPAQETQRNLNRSSTATLHSFETEL